MTPGMSKATGARPLFISILLVAAIASAITATAALAQANKKPITRQKLVNAVKLNGYSTSELVAEINRRGVDFEMTADAEQELRSVGARPEVVDAARSNYRAASMASTSSQPARTPPPRPTHTGPAVPAGDPLSKSEIVTLLQSGLPSSRVEQFVEVRGVSFAVTPQITAEIKAAGGDRSLIGAITEKAQSQPASNSNGYVDSPFGSNGSSASNVAPAYDDYMDQASTAAARQDWNGAIGSAQQAIQLDPSQSQAYQLLGTMLLYARNDFQGAEQAMRAAIERGGSARFIVFHDHEDGTFQQYCQGSFFVTKTGVSFKADNGADTFDTADSNIKEAKTNAFIGSKLGAFHIKPVQQINGRGNFNFAPATRNKAEAQMLLRLMGAY